MQSRVSSMGIEVEMGFLSNSAGNSAANRIRTTSGSPTFTIARKTVWLHAAVFWRHDTEYENVLSVAQLLWSFYSSWKEKLITECTRKMPQSCKNVPVVSAYYKSGSRNSKVFWSLIAIANCSIRGFFYLWSMMDERRYLQYARSYFALANYD